MFVNLHRHDQFSLFDGYGTAKKAVQYADSIGQEALGIANHGNVSGIIEHYSACKETGIKPILGSEIYFQPKFIQPGQGKKTKRYHLTVFVMNLKGYYNLMEMLSVANRDYFNRYPCVTLELLKRYSEGLIVLSGCYTGLLSRLIDEEKFDLARKLSLQLKSIFGQNYYHELVLYDGQVDINKRLIELSEDIKVRSVLTLDSHFIEKGDYESYKVLCKLGDKEVNPTYENLYMLKEEEVFKRFKDLHGFYPRNQVGNLNEIVGKIDDFELDFKESIPQLYDNSRSKLKELVETGLRNVRKNKKQYMYLKRVEKELQTIFDKNFQDYFLLCHDIVSFAKQKRIGMGYGRGSVCGSLVAYLIGLTKVDPIYFKTSFERFLRPDKTSLPDIDMDFEAKRRNEVLEYALNKFKGRALQVTNFGYFKVKNLANEMGKLYNVDSDSLKKFKKELGSMEEEQINRESLMLRDKIKIFNSKYNGFVDHFCNLYGQVRYIGRHAAGIVIAKDNIDKYVSTMRIRNSFQTSYDMNSLDKINMVKLDILGLDQATILRETFKRVKTRWVYSYLKDEDVYSNFQAGFTNGIFQFEKEGAKDVLAKVKPNNIQDLIACNALNRPAPIQLGILDAFVQGKAGYVDNSKPWYRITKDTYGAIVYQEQVLKICRKLAGMEWQDVDKVMKSLKPGEDPEKKRLRKLFIKGITLKHDVSKSEAIDLFNHMTQYLFNKGHGTGYTLMSFASMWLKTNHPLEFFNCLLRNEKDEFKRSVYKAEAAKCGILILLPHVNATVNYEIVDFDGERVVQEGLGNLKGVGSVTAQEIIKRNPFKHEYDFEDKVEKRYCNVRVRKILEDAGALEFDEDKYLKRVISYNGSLYGREG